MFSQLRPRSVFVLAIGLHVASALLAAFTIFKVYESEKWVRHTYQVLFEVGQLQSNLSKAGLDRRAFLDSRDASFQKDFSHTRQTLAAELASLHSLTADNPEQEGNCSRLDENVKARLATLEASMRAGGLANSDGQDKYTDKVVQLAFETAATADHMELIEQNLLEQRRTITNSLFVTIIAILLLAFGLSIFFFRLYYKMLSKELYERKIAEANGQFLSAALMRVQDEERRKFSRELHDSLGQMLIGAKMLAARLAMDSPGSERLPELEAMLDDAVKETRSISHLLHPPLLDEIGFVSAAQWFTESYSERTGIAVTFDCPANLVELPKSLELVLFRVLQESLTNVHKHSRSRTAEVRVSNHGQEISLQVRDCGVGIPPKTLEAFLSKGTGVGIGLAGIRQRVNEQSGKLSVRSDGKSGTVVSVCFKLTVQDSPIKAVTAS